MTSRQASDQAFDDEASDDDASDDTVRPTSPRDLPTWLGDALDRLMTDAPPTAAYSLNPEPESVTSARHFTAATLHGWGLTDLCDDVALIVSELVTNALRHSLPLHVAGAPSLSLRSAATIRLRLLRHPPYVLCGVVDSARMAPRRREPDFIAESGRGLHIVESFSDRWGWTPLPAGGKIVWALFGAASV